MIHTQLDTTGIDITLDDLNDATSRYTSQALFDHLTHEIRQPLVAITNFSFALTREIESSETASSKAVHWANKASTSVERISQIVGDFGAKVGSFEFSTGCFNIDEIALHTVKLLAESSRFEGCNVLCDFNSDSIPAFCDPLAAMVALTAVLTNASEAYPNDSQERPIRLTAKADQLGAVLTVRDYGNCDPAFDAEEYGRPFVSSKPNHLGLGGTVAAHCMGHMKGGIEFYKLSPGAKVELRFQNCDPSHSPNGTTRIL